MLSSTIVAAISTVGFGLPSLHSGKESTCQCRRCKRCGFKPQVRKIPGIGNGNPLQYSCLESSMDRRVWWGTVHGAAKSQIRLSTAHTLLLLPREVVYKTFLPKRQSKGLWKRSLISYYITVHATSIISHFFFNTVQ